MIQRVHDAREPERPGIGLGPTTGPWDGPSDPAYLLTEIEELRLAALRGGYGTLAHLLTRAADEARAQARRRAGHGTRGKP
jgi:hypothetical protein